jgi:ubiquinone/menaquinone biosynthesis C-methylase UbiE
MGAVGVYAKYVLPHFIDLSMRNRDAARVRAEWVPQARGDVLEVGIGSGLNLPLYSGEVRRVYGVDPSMELQKMARKRMTGKALEVEFLSQSAAERLPLPDKSADTVVMTWTLCSISDPRSALREMRRVLKPDGRLIFVEHGRAPDAGVAVWQDRLTPVWKRIGGGCHLNRKVDALLAEAGFTIDELRTTYLPGPRPMTFTYQGFARREP